MRRLVTSRGRRVTHERITECRSSVKKSVRLFSFCHIMQRVETRAKIDQRKIEGRAENIRYRQFQKKCIGRMYEGTKI